jgi:hypothetical protein
MRKVWLLLAIVIIALLFISGNPLTIKQKAGLQITTDNVPATLFLNDQYLDKSPFSDKKIQPNSYVLRIVPDDTNLAPYEIPIKLNKGTVAVVNWKPGTTSTNSSGLIYEMEKLNSNDTQIEMQTIPDGAIVTFDQGAKQFTPLLMTGVSEGVHEFEVSLPSFETQQHTVNVPKGHRVIITAILGRTGDLPQGTTESVSQDDSESSAGDSLDQLGGPQVQILSTNFFVNEQEVLRVRASANQGGAELGFAAVGQFYPYLDEVTDWFQIDFEDQPGWVSAQFSQKVATDSTQAN